MATSAIQILSLDELAHLPEPEWLIGGILEQSSLATLYGPSDSGKSFVALSMACAVAGGWNWCDRPTQSGDVLYLCAEGRGGIPEAHPGLLPRSRAAHAGAVIRHSTRPGSRRG